MQLNRGLLSFEQLQGMRSEFVLDTSQVSEIANKKPVTVINGWIINN